MSSRTALEQLGRSQKRLVALFSLVLVVMVLHEAEHVAQVVQKDALDASCPNDCRGLLGFIFDIEWVHVAYNHSLLLALAALYLGCGLWRRRWRSASPVAWSLLTVGIFVIQAYHVVEHTVKLEQWFANGRRSPTPGILGQKLSLVELHFALNTTVLVLVLAGYIGFRFHRRLWELRTPRRLALVAATAALLAAAGAAAYAQRPPTVRLSAGVHEGPIVLDRPQRLVSERGAVVRGGIRVTSDDVVVRDVTVVGGESGIVVDGAESVVLDGVTVMHAALDGINVRRGSVAIRDCTVRSLRSRYAQGIDISFSFDLPPSAVERCTVVGGQEGLVSHSAKVLLRDNRVSGTRLRGIAVTEMSMGSIERNEVRDSLGVGIFCGDYSVCEIEENVVSKTRPDHASGDLTRMGFGILAHYGAAATLDDNELSESPGGVAALLNAHVERQ